MKNGSKAMALFVLLQMPLVAQAFDLEQYRQLANHTVRQMETGVAGDIDALIASQEQLMVLGIDGGVNYLADHGNDDTRPLQLVILNAEKMKELSLEEIERLWHGGEFLAAKGIDQNKINHFGTMMNLMDSIIHPATTYLLLKEYKRTGDPSLLARVRAELIEVLEHANHIKPDTQFAAQ